MHYTKSICIILDSLWVPVGIDNHMCFFYTGALSQSSTSIAHVTCRFAKAAKPQRHTPNPAAFVFDRPSIPQIALISLLILFRNCVPTFPHLAITMAFCITFGTHGKSSCFDPETRVDPVPGVILSDGYRIRDVANIPCHTY